MKDSLNHLDLWQKKRNELPVHDESKQDWLAMQSLLNTHLPNPLVKHTLASKVVKIIKGLKTWSILSLTLPATVVVAVLAYVYIIKPKHPAPLKNHKKHGVVISKDSLLNLNSDSLNKTDSLPFEKDSTTAGKKPTDTIVNKSEAINITKPDSTGQYVQSKGKSVATAGSVIIYKNRITNYAAINNHKKSVLPGNRVYTLPGNKINNLSGPNKNTFGTSPGSSSNLLTDQTISEAGAQQTLVQGSNSFSSQLLVKNSDDTFYDRNGFFGSSATITDSTSGTNIHNTPVKSVVRMITADNKKISVTNNRINDKKLPKPKPVKNRGTSLSVSALDYGILVGVNTSNSFTSKAQNNNFYGSLPLDIYLGLYGTYHLNQKLAINMQVKGLNPFRFSGSYNHKNESRIDTNQTLTINDSRKAYFVTVPIHLVYNITPNINIKGGPVINIPVKQINGSTTYQTSGTKKDSLGYYNTLTSKLNATKYDQKLDFGFSGGISLQQQRFILEATYSKSFKGYNVVSELGSYKSNPGSVQITIGFQLNKPKKRTE